MGASNPAKAYPIPGRLLANPSIEPASGTFPFGGRELGSFSEFALRWLGEPYPVIDETTGLIDTILEPAAGWTVGFLLNGSDDDARELLFPRQAEAGTRTRHARFDSPGAGTAGETAENRALRLLFVPHATEHHDALLLYAGVAFLADGGEIKFSPRERQSVPVAVHAMPDSSGRLLRWSRLRDVRL